MRECDVSVPDADLSPEFVDEQECQRKRILSCGSNADDEDRLTEIPSVPVDQTLRSIKLKNFPVSEIPIS